MEKDYEKRERDKKRRVELEKRRLEEEERKKQEQIQLNKQKEIENKLEKIRIHKQILEYREKNLNPVRPALSDLKKLDSSIKKNTAFTRKLATKISLDNEQSLINELKRLNLTRYVSEVVNGVVSCQLKNSDIEPAVKICSELHQRYLAFTDELIPSLIRIFDEDKNESVSKRLYTLRLLTELLLYGVFNDIDVLYALLENFIESETPRHGIPLILCFVRCSSTYLLGIDEEVDESNEELAELDTLSDLNIIDEQKMEQFSELINGYYDIAIEYLLNIHKDLREQEKENQKQLSSKGELDPETNKKWESMKSTFERVLHSVSALADQLHLDVPELDEDSTVTRLGKKTEETIPIVLPLWDDEPTRAFYEDLLDISSHLSEPENVEDTDDKKLNKFLTELPNCVSIDSIDAQTVNFCKNFNSKGNRKKLASSLFNILRSRLDILPFYSRMVANLFQHYNDIGNRIVKDLVREFSKLYEEKDQLKIESKIKNIRFLSELVKFQVCPPDIIFTCLKKCLDDFVHHNIDIACTLLETCGCFLYRTPENTVKMGSMLDRMIRLKDMKSLEERYNSMIEAAYFTLRPPEQQGPSKREKSPIELYVQKLIFEDLKKKNAGVILKKLRKLDWQKHEQLAMRILLKIDKAKYSNLPLIAGILAGLKSFHELFVIKYVDALVEEITVSIELGTYSRHQKLIMILKFLGDLYWYQILDHDIVFDRLYFLIGTPVIDGVIVDKPNDLFRIRLVCTLLDSCGMYLKKEFREEIDIFLTYFQRYILTKEVFNNDVAYMIDDTFEKLRSKNQPRNNSQSKEFFVAKKSNFNTQKESEEIEETEEDLEEAFEREFKEMVSERHQMDHTTGVNVSNMSIPLHINQETTNDTTEGMKKVKMLIRKGNKGKITSLEIPEGSLLDISKEKDEQVDLKKKILEYDLNNREQETETPHNSEPKTFNFGSAL
eukprot:TRINITY_DN179_c0_g1_i1.p1 TRINITY_DN179_c0_g1~~TRINITY_DN179_c0_g1_i1.p1  ORF type:complete len:1067 (-),score=270.91 TRINITY_DN179_c0_g1_i1:151-2997(-)